jgi:hypothetical protein
MMAILGTVIVYFAIYESIALRSVVKKRAVKFLSWETIGHGDSGAPCRGNPELTLPGPFTMSWSGALKVARYSGTIPTGIISSSA